MSAADPSSDNAPTDKLTGVSNGETVTSLGRLRASQDAYNCGEPLRARLDEDGYVFLPGLLDAQSVHAARRDIFTRLADVGEIAHPPEAGIFSGSSQRDALVTDRGIFWRSVSETWTLRRLTHGAVLGGVMQDLLGTEARPQDYLFLRPASPGKRTLTHCDAPFFTRTTDHVLTAWIALGEIPPDLGPLYVIEGSHRFDDFIEYFRDFDVARDTSRKAALSQSPQALAAERGTRLLTAHFQPGDVVIFNMHLLHGALDNVATDNAVRLSCDVRFQPSDAPCDPRYFGPDPTGTTGAGYGELVGAKPLTEEWHIR